MRIALIGIGKFANYPMQAITHTKGISLVDTHWTLGRNYTEILHRLLFAALRSPRP